MHQKDITLKERKDIRDWTFRTAGIWTFKVDFPAREAMCSTCATVIPKGMLGPESAGSQVLMLVPS
jgi:hypothetical protein